MRAFYLFVLLVFVVAIGIFAMQNSDPVTVTFLDRSIHSSLPVLVAAIYVLGMITGWTVVGVLRRSMQRVTARRA